MRHLSALLLLGLATSAWAEPVGRGEPAPATTFVDANSTSATARKKVTSKDLAGRLSLWFFLDGAAEQLDEIRLLEQFRREMRDDQLEVLVVLVVPPEQTAQALDLARGHGLSMALDKTGGVAEVWGAAPGSLFLVDGAGYVQEHLDLTQWSLTEPAGLDDLEYRVEAIMLGP